MDVKILDDIVQKGKTLGIAVAVARTGGGLAKYVAGEGLGINETFVLKASTLFDVGPMTGALSTSLIWAALISQKKINLNTLVCNFWTEFAEEGKGSITIRHLLKHTSGLPASRPYFGDILKRHPDWIGTDRAKSTVFDNISLEELEYPPTYTLLPSDIGYMVLGHVAEIIAEKPINTIFEDLVSKAIGLENTQFIIPQEMRSRCAASMLCPHRRSLIQGEVFDANAWVAGGAAGHAGLFTTAEDAAITGVAVSDALREKNNFISQIVANEFFGPKAKYKMGWETPNRKTPLCGSFFSTNTIGYVSPMGMSLWVDLDKEMAMSVFACFSETEPSAHLEAVKGFSLFLPDIYNYYANKT